MLSLLSFFLFTFRFLFYFSYFSLDAFFIIAIVLLSLSRRPRARAFQAIRCSERCRRAFTPSLLRQPPRRSRSPSAPLFFFRYAAITKTGSQASRQADAFFFSFDSFADIAAARCFHFFGYCCIFDYCDAIV